MVTAMPRTDQQTEQKILDAAHRVFVAHGTAGARMQQIADEAGVNKALLHYYFRSKDRLAAAVFERVARRLFPPLMGILEADASIEDKVSRVVDHYLTTLAGAPYLPGYILCELNHHPERMLRLIEEGARMPVEGLAPRLFARLHGQIEERVRSGSMRPITAPQFALNLISLCLFPFAARPMVKVAFGWDDEGFDSFIAERKQALPGFFLNALRP
jgi:TetR/AcrR family transcriptional regulator